MKRVCVVGNIGGVLKSYDGQRIKTKILAQELRKSLGKSQVKIVDTSGGINKLYNIVIQIIKQYKECENIIILPGENGIKVVVPLCFFLHFFFKRGLHYVVIGGWLPQYLKSHRILELCLQYFDGIYVETKKMKFLLEDKFHNVYVMPNFKDIKILSCEELVYTYDRPYKICTFSRVMKEKGIEEVVDTVIKANNFLKDQVFYLDIYGKIEEEQIEWFNNMQEKFPDYIQYKGIVPYNKSTKVIKNYVALMFLTHYEGEGFPGTILDAFSSGVPVIATDWKYNSEIIDNGINGMIVECNFENTLIYISMNIEKWNLMKKNCLKKAEIYAPSKCIGTLLEKLK